MRLASSADHLNYLPTEDDSPASIDPSVQPA